MGYPEKGSPKRGLARWTYEPEVPPWEFDIRAVMPGDEPMEISDWHRRRGAANNKEGNIDRAASVLAGSLSIRRAVRDRGPDR